MAGLSVLLQSQKTTQILSKANMLKPYTTLPSSPPPLSPSSSLPTSTFLESCYLCKKKISQEEDIYMYGGDKAFCSVECRDRQIFMDEESVRRDNYCSLAAAASSSSTSSPAARHRKVAKNRAAAVASAATTAGGFAY